MESVELNEECLASMDCVVIVADHSCYNIDEVVAHSKLVFDTRGATRGLKQANIVRLGE
jgi:UDP-N-acetyl-D-glucosamine dehydrogenase